MLPIFALVPTAISVLLPAGTATLDNAARTASRRCSTRFTSTTENNGSAFAGLGGNLYFNILTGVVMLCGRFLFLIPALALAGSLAGKKSVAETAGTFTTLLADLRRALLGVIVIVGALTFFPADALGPIVEHLLMLQGKTF